MAAEVSLLLPRFSTLSKLSIFPSTRLKRPERLVPKSSRPRASRRHRAHWEKHQKSSEIRQLLSNSDIFRWAHALVPGICICADISKFSSFPPPFPRRHWTQFPRRRTRPSYFRCQSTCSLFLWRKPKKLSYHSSLISMKLLRWSLIKRRQRRRKAWTGRGSSKGSVSFLSSNLFSDNEMVKPNLTISQIYIFCRWNASWKEMKGKKKHFMYTEPHDSSPHWTFIAE